MRFNKAELNEAREVIARFQLATGKKLYRLAEVVDWADERGELPLTVEAVRLANEALFREASRTDTIDGPDGSKVRVRHCVEGVVTNGGDEPTQETLWAHIEDAPYAFMVEAFLQRRGRIEADVKQLRADMDYANAVFRARGEREIQLSFDFGERDEDEGVA